MSQTEPRICIVGAGMSGMLMAIKLKQAGHSQFTIYEKAAEVGGTWRENRYPGVACDVASFSYCYDFEPNPDWSHRFSPGPEIFAYFRRVAVKYGLLEHIRFETELTQARFQDRQWHIETNRGERAVYDMIVAATGPLNHCKFPDIPGLADFAGHCFHSAQWPDDLDLTGMRIGILGTGSSAVQMTAPLADIAAHLSVFQRTPQWIMPTPNPAYSALSRAMKRRFPLLGRITRRFYDWVGLQFGLAALEDGWRRRLIAYLCRRNLRTIKDEALRAQLTPDHVPMCKRMIVSESYFPALQRDNVSLVTTGIDHIAAEGIATCDGQLHRLDALVLATGFHPNAWGLKSVIGEHGQSLSEAWAAGTRTYRSITMPGFPNYFMLIGPNSPITNLSLIDIADIGVDYVMQCIERRKAGDFVSLSPREDVTRAFNDDLSSAFGDTVWVSGCNSWYLDNADGIPATWPWSPTLFRSQLASPDFSDYEFG